MIALAGAGDVNDRIAARRQRRRNQDKDREEECGGDVRKHLCRSRCSVMLHRLSLFFGLLGIVPLLPQNQMHQ